MVLTTTQPYTKEGQNFNRLAMSLAISSSGEGKIMVNMRLVPTAIDTIGGTRIYDNDGTKALVMPDLLAEVQSDPAIAAAAQQIFQALQGLVNAKGL